MPLSDHEQRILAEIEKRLLEEDPKFAHQVGSSFRAHLARRLKLAVAGFLLGLIVLVAGFVEYVALGVAGFVIMLASVFVFVRTLRRRASVERPVNAGGQPPPASGGGRPAPKGGVASWWGRMNERWRQRWEERGGPGPPP
jgi:Protein of unknown function (DUF3040)